MESLKVGNRIWRSAAMIGKKQSEFFIYPVEFDWSGRNPMFRARREMTASGNSIWVADDAYQRGIVCVVKEEIDPAWAYMLVIDISPTGKLAFVKPIVLDQSELEAQYTKHRRDRNGSLKVVKETLIQQEIREGGRSLVPPLRQQIAEQHMDGSRDLHKFRDQGRFGSPSIRDAYHGESKP